MPASAGGWTAYRRPGEPAGDVSAPLASEVRDRFDEIAAASDTGAALFVTGTSAMLVLPPFPVEQHADYDAIVRAPLVETLARPRSYAVFLLRLGGFSVGFFRGDTLVGSKTGQRFVENRHRKGGQSQRRFERARERHVHELYVKACAAARATLAPHEREIERAFLGGTAETLRAFRRECDYFERYGSRLSSRPLEIRGDPRRAMLASMPRQVLSSDVYTVDTSTTAGPGAAMC